MNGYKYELGSRITAKEDIPYTSETFEGEETEGVIPNGTAGEINSCGRDSRYGYVDMYDVQFVLDNGENEEITFFLSDLENTCIIQLPEEGTES